MDGGTNQTIGGIEMNRREALEHGIAQANLTAEYCEWQGEVNRKHCHYWNAEKERHLDRADWYSRRLFLCDEESEK